MQFFFRNLAAFDASKRLSELGYLCEVASILRTALEQFAFCAQLWSLPGSENLQSIRPLHSLNSLKRFVPAAGRLYGLLSKYAHFEYEHHTHFFTRSSERVQTIRMGSPLRGYATHLLLIAMVCVSKYILQMSPEQFGEAPKSISELNEFCEQVNQYSDTVCSTLKSDVIFAELDILLQQILSDAHGRALV
jgi:hypothetical protein